MNKFRSGIYPSSFKIIRKPPARPTESSKLYSLQLIEVHLFKNFLSIKDVLERTLIVNTLLALSVFYIRTNSVKWFNMSKPEKMHLRNSILKLGQFYYNESIRLLRLLISKKNFNLELSIVLSDLLNKISIYEYKTLNNCVIFSKGVISIFSKLLDFNHLSDETRMILTFLNYSAKTIYFPTYNHVVLKEFGRVLATLEPFIAATSDSNTFLYNHLQKYLHTVMMYFESDQDRSNNHVMYQILRNWLINLPSNIQLIDYCKDPLEVLILKLYKTLGKILDNLFPFVNYLFLTNFQGSIQLFNTPVYNVQRRNWAHPVLAHIDNYCIRVTTFFLKRLNILSIFVGYQNFNNNSEVSFDQVLNSYNEVMIDNFNDQFIKFYNYMHLPSQALIGQREHMQGFAESNPDLYAYNKHHVDLIKTGSPVVLEPESEPDFDPVLSHHMSHLGADISVFPKKDPGSGRITYDLFFNSIDCNRIRTCFDNDYKDLISCFYNYNNFNQEHNCHFSGNNIISNDPIEFDIDYEKGFDYRDSDVKDLLMNPHYPFLNLNENNLKNFDIHEFLNKFNHVVEEEEVEVYDMGEEYYTDSL